MGQEKEEGYEKEDYTGFEFSAGWLAGLKNPLWIRPGENPRGDGG